MIQPPPAESPAKYCSGAMTVTTPAPLAVPDTNLAPPPKTILYSRRANSAAGVCLERLAGRCLYGPAGEKPVRVLELWKGI